jgi:hypothetical protein
MPLPSLFRDTYEVSRWLFLRALGFVFLVAFLSLFNQLHGLIGSTGILPAVDFLNAAKGHLGNAAYHAVPTLFWLDIDDALLTSGCFAGAFLAILAILNVFPIATLTGCFVMYLSFVTVGQQFFAFQWDMLLLEAGFLAIFLAPNNSRQQGDPRAIASPLAVLLLQWLLFRLLFTSGLAKWLSGDPAWHGFTALEFHYFTQPLPTVIGWFVSHLPAWFHKGSTIVMFVIEIAMPVFFFGSRSARTFACLLQIGLQIFIALTGNFAFFNLLTAALCLMLLDDGFWSNRFKKRIGVSEPDILILQKRPHPSRIAWTGGIILIGLSLIQTGERLRWLDRDHPLAGVMQVVEPFRIVNAYGLFEVMTTDRDEIIVEGSHDGTTWARYAFKHKPGDLGAMPGFVAPHQPRLDWQMWFAALGECRDNPWVVAFTHRLLKGESTVLGLMGENPFALSPPMRIRLLRYNYAFTDWQTWRATGNWWQAQYAAEYCPEMRLSRR